MSKLTDAGYPSDWSRVARECKERASWTCQGCGAAHGTWGSRDRAGRFLQVDKNRMRAEGHGAPPFMRRLSRGGYVKVVEVILQAAHLDGTPSNCDPSNLRALCQVCHLAYDLAQHVRTGAVTRRRRMGTPDLF